MRLNIHRQSLIMVILLLLYITLLLFITITFAITLGEAILFKNHYFFILFFIQI